MTFIHVISLSSEQPRDEEMGSESNNLPTNNFLGLGVEGGVGGGRSRHVPLFSVIGREQINEQMHGE